MHNCLHAQPISQFHLSAMSQTPPNIHFAPTSGGILSKDHYEHMHHLPACAVLTKLRNRGCRLCWTSTKRQKYLTLSCPLKFLNLKLTHVYELSTHSHTQPRNSSILWKLSLKMKQFRYSSIPVFNAWHLQCLSSVNGLFPTSYQNATSD